MYRLEPHEVHWTAHDGSTMLGRGFKVIGPRGGVYESRDWEHALPLSTFERKRVAGLQVVGEQHAPDLDHGAFTPGNRVQLRCVPHPTDPNAVPVCDLSGQLRCGWIPRQLNVDAHRLVGQGADALVAWEWVKAGQGRVSVTLLLAHADAVKGWAELQPMQPAEMPEAAMAPDHGSKKPRSDHRTRRNGCRKRDVGVDLYGACSAVKHEATEQRTKMWRRVR